MEKKGKKTRGDQSKNCSWVSRSGLDVLISSRMEAFSDVFEGDLAEVGLDGEYGLALHLCEGWAIESARELEVGKGCSGVLVLVHFVVLVSWAGSNVEHIEI
jgi:hypothetical protein